MMDGLTASDVKIQNDIVDITGNLIPVTNGKKPLHIQDTDFVIMEFHCCESGRTSHRGTLAGGAPWDMAKRYIRVKL